MLLKTGSAQDELNIINSKWLEYSDSQNALYHHLTGRLYKYLDKREELVSGLKSADSWKQRQGFIKETLFDITGPFPEKTPLNPVVVSTFKRDGYTIENIIFESQPGFYVTSSLFRPAALKKGIRYPAIIYCSGHSEEGYRSAIYQHVIINLVKKGFLVFAFDPVGQGERLEYFDPLKGKSVVGGPTKEHSYPGAQALICGSSQAKIMIWDGIRAVDYLLTRPDIDPARIGITGRSGGGTQSACIAAFDDRIYAAAPENYITNYRRLLQSIGPQDAEQNLTGLISRGLDHPDFLIVRAPKPALMITTSNDMFSLQGAIETENEVAIAYKALGKAGNFSRVEDYAGHASTQKNREAMYAFFQQHLNNPGNPMDEPVQTPLPEELRVSKTGQLSTSLGGKTAFSINRDLAQNLENDLNSSRVDISRNRQEVIKAAKRLSGFFEPDYNDNPVLTGRIKRDNYTIEKYFLRGEGSYVIPYLLFKPQHPNGKGMIYLHPDGKSADAMRGGLLENLVSAGVTLLVPDLAGTGELSSGLLKGDAWFDGVSHNLWYAAMLSGRSITGLQAGDVLKLLSILKKEKAITEISGCAVKEMTPVMLHAAVFSGDLRNVLLLEPCISWMSIVKERFYNPRFVPGAVPGALREYDLPDLAAALAPGRLFIAGATDGSGTVTDTSSISEGTEVIRKQYGFYNADAGLKIISGKHDDSLKDEIMEWIK